MKKIKNHKLFTYSLCGRYFIVAILGMLFFCNSCNFKPSSNILDQRQKQVVPEKEKFYQIHFQENFIQDEISVYVEGDTLVTNRILNTDKRTGICMEIIEFRIKNEIELFSSYYTTKSNAPISKIKFKPINNQFDVLIYVNGEKNTLTLNLEQSKYIGISKSSTDSNIIVVVKSNYPFSYD